MVKNGLFLVTVVSAIAAGVRAQSMDDFSMRHDAKVIPGMRHGKSRPVREIAVHERREGEDEDRPVGKGPRPEAVPGFVDPAAQDWAGGNLGLGGEVPSIGHGFDGVASGALPLDPNGDVGPRHYVQYLNASVLFYDKTGTLLHGPVSVNSLWTSQNVNAGPCATENVGDGLVIYDRLADRWVISQLNGVRDVLPDGSVNGTECVAVSETSDPLGAYYLYSFGSYHYFNDYPKMGVWPDGYYVTYNMFNSSGTIFQHATTCAFDRNRMLIGAAANQLCFDFPVASGRFFGVLPSTFTGSTVSPPPAGSPNHLVSLNGTAALDTWNFFVNWAASPSATLAGPVVVSVATFTDASPTGSVPQPGTTERLDALGDRMMYPYSYRNFGDHESLVVNHTVSTVVGGVQSYGPRWYELRLNNNVPFVFQQSTYAPAAGFRFMGSAAMDQAGNIALGYTFSSTSQYPSVEFTGRTAVDPLSTMTQGETVDVVSGGAQLPATCTRADGTTYDCGDRWGDYSMMAVDPADDCTFWYTAAYQPVAGTRNALSRATNFKLPGCPTQWFGLSANPATPTTSTVISSQAFAGFSGAINLSVSGPTQASYAFSATSIGAPDSSTLTFNPRSLAAGTYPITITGTAGGVAKSITVSWNNPGSPCGPYTCGGCCDGAGVCHAKTNTFCGADGESCQDCTSIGYICIETNTCTGEWGCVDPTCSPKPPPGCFPFCP